MTLQLTTEPVRLIFNGAAGSAAAVAVDRLRGLLDGSGCSLAATTAPGDAQRQARRAVEEGVGRVVVAGGDGTVSQVVDGLAPHFDRVELGIVPLGTGNDLARSLGLVLDDPARALRHALAAPATAIDLVGVSESDAFMVNAASGGVGGKVAADVAQADKTRWGPFAYWLTAVSELVDMRRFEVHLELDETSKDLRVYGLVIANGRFVGGGFPIAPRSFLNDGLVDVTVIPELPTLDLLAAGLNFMLLRNHDAEPVRTYRAKRVRVSSSPEMLFSVDGEPIERIDTTFEVLPRALRVVAGEKAPALVPGTDKVGG